MLHFSTDAAPQVLWKPNLSLRYVSLCQCMVNPSASSLYWLCKNHCIVWRFRGLEVWSSGESTGFPRLWPEFDSLTRCHMWIEFVGSVIYSERFFSGNPFKCVLLLKYILVFISRSRCVDRKKNRFNKGPLVGANILPSKISRSQSALALHQGTIKLWFVFVDRFGSFFLGCRYINNSLHLARKYARIFVRGHYLFRESNSFPRAKLEENCELRGTDNVQGQISEHIFKAKLRLLCLLSIRFKNWGISSDIPQV